MYSKTITIKYFVLKGFVITITITITIIEVTNKYSSYLIITYINCLRSNIK